jgi:hypothetical protein
MAQGPFRQSWASAKPFTVTPNKNDRLVHIECFSALVSFSEQEGVFIFQKWENVERWGKSIFLKKFLSILKKRLLMKI